MYVVAKNAKTTNFSKVLQKLPNLQKSQNLAKLCSNSKIFKFHFIQGLLQKLPLFAENAKITNMLESFVTFANLAVL